jgi:hypothetical protein
MVALAETWCVESQPGGRDCDFHAFNLIEHMFDKSRRRICVCCILCVGSLSYPKSKKKLMRCLNVQLF